MTEINSKIHPIKMEQCSIPIEIEEEQKEADNALEWHPQHLHEVVAVAMVVKNWLRPQRERAKEQQRNAEILAATNEVNTSLVFEPMAITMERIRVLKQLGRSPSQNSLLASAGMRPGSKISSASLLSNGGAKKASSADISHKSSTIGAALMPMPTALNEADKEEITATGTRIVEGRNGNAIGAKINEMTEAETTVGQERELVGQEDGSRGRKLRESMAIWLRTTSREIIALPHISIDPIGNFYAYWTFCVYLVFLYNAFMCVLFVFDDTQGNAFFALWLTINALCDSVNLFDLFINSRLTYMEDGMLMKDWRRLTKRYLRRWHFPMDLLAIFPLDLILLLNRNISLSRVNRLAKCYRVWEFVQYNNFIVSGPFFWPLNKEATNLGRLYAIQIKSQMLCQFHNRVNVLFHWNAALYFKISLFYGIFTTDPAAWEFNLVKNQDPIWVDCGQVLWAEIGEGECGFNESGRGDPDTERANYLEEMVKYWTNRSELLHFSNFSKQYSLSFYWSSLTLTTSGQQPYPTAAMHNFLEIFDTIVGVLVFAVIVGSVGNVVTTMNRGRAEIQQLNDGIKFYMNYRNVSDGMQKRVLDCIHYIQRHAQIQNEETIMGTIPPRLRGELAVHLHMETLRGIELFADCEPSLLYELVLRLQMQMFAPNDFICRRGDLAKEMYVLKRGVLAVINDDDDSEEQHQKRLGKGNAFGEMAILRPTGPLGRLLSRRPHSLRSLGYSEVYLLTQEDALAVFVDYPEQRHSLIQKATEILIARGQLKPEDLVQQGPLSPVEFCGIESTIEVLQKLEGTLEEIDVQLDQLYAKFTNNSSEMKREMTSLEVNYRQIRQKMKAKVEEE